MKEVQIRPSVVERWFLWSRLWRGGKYKRIGETLDHCDYGGRYKRKVEGEE